jgi:glutathione S-transferase
VIRLYGEPRSRAFRCIWTLEELGLDYELVPVEGRFTVADLDVAVMFWRPPLAKVDRSPWPRLEAWLERCRARPAFARMAERLG